MARLYIGNLPYVAQKKDVLKLFDDHGIQIHNVDMSIDPFTGRNPSYCFVDLDSELVESTMSRLQGLDLRGRPVRINFSTEKRAKPSDLVAKTYNLGRTAREVHARKANNDAYVFKRWTSSDEAESHWSLPVDEKRRLYVGGLPQIFSQATVNADMRELFGRWDITAVSKIIWPPARKRLQQSSQYYCFVDFASTAEADDARLEMNGTPTPYGGTYHVEFVDGRPKKVLREQFGGVWPTDDKAKPVRNLEGNWRRMEA